MTRQNDRLWAHEVALQGDHKRRQGAPPATVFRRPAMGPEARASGGVLPSRVGQSAGTSSNRILLLTPSARPGARSACGLRHAPNSAVNRPPFTAQNHMQTHCHICVCKDYPLSRLASIVTTASASARRISPLSLSKGTRDEGTLTLAAAMIVAPWSRIGTATVLTPTSSS